jgi:hypothetical protein
MGFARLRLLIVGAIDRAFPDKRARDETAWPRRYPPVLLWSRPYRREGLPGALGWCVSPSGPSRYERVALVRSTRPPHAVIAAYAGPGRASPPALG